MIRLAYTLKDSELRHYYQFLMSSDPQLLHERFHAASWVPMGFLIFLIILRAPWYAWIIAVVCSLVWVFWGSQIVFNDVVSTAWRRQKNRPTGIRELEVEDNHGVLKVGGVMKKITGYAAYLDLLIVQLDKGENLIVPERAFECKECAEQFVKDIIIAAHQEQEAMMSAGGE